MIVNGDEPDSLEAQVLMAKHKAGAPIEYRMKDPVDSWKPRKKVMNGADLCKGNVYRLANSKRDN